MLTSSIQQLRSGFRGQLLTPEQEGYDQARAVFNAAINRRPALIAKCTCTGDVVQAVQFAREQRVVVSVRGTGHNVAGFAVCDDGIVIDLSPMKDIQVNAEVRTVRAGGGCNWGEVNDALHPYGLAATGGFVSITGVGGLTLGGGLGWLVRKYGLALDNLLSAEVVLADGRVVTVSMEENADLFWALRGGGGNFGVVTAFVFRAHPEASVLAGVTVHPVETAQEALRTWREFERSAPEESNMGALLFHFADNEHAPPPLRGKGVVGLGGVYAGPINKGEQVLQPLRAFGSPLVDLFQPMPYREAQRMADFLWPPGLLSYWKSTYLREMSDEVIDVVVDFFARVPSPQTVIVLEHNGNSAWDRVPEAATAFGSRSSPFNFVVTSAWADPRDTERNVAWTREFVRALQPYAGDGAYVNYLGGDEGVEGLRAAYGTKLTRLAELKARYDPVNLFCMNQNIAPAAKRPAVKESYPEGYRPGI